MDRNVELMVMESIIHLSDISPEAPSLSYVIKEKGYYISLTDYPINLFKDGVAVLIDSQKNVSNMNLYDFNEHNKDLFALFRLIDKIGGWHKC
jgi:hypothetical protein